MLMLFDGNNFNRMTARFEVEFILISEVPKIPPTIFAKILEWPDDVIFFGPVQLNSCLIEVGLGPKTIKPRYDLVSFIFRDKDRAKAKEQARSFKIGDIVELPST
jgi:hypothetical protein